MGKKWSEEDNALELFAVINAWAAEFKVQVTPELVRILAARLWKPELKHG